jgi:hypothetical protein
MFTSLEHLRGHIVELGLDLRQQILDLASVQRSANVYDGRRWLVFTKAVSSWALEISSTLPIAASVPEGPLVGPLVSLLCSAFEEEDTLSGVAMPKNSQGFR